MMLFYENPDIYVANFSNWFDASHEVHLHEIGFKIAFGVNDYRNGVPYDDPNFVKWTVRMVSYKNQ